MAVVLAAAVPLVNFLEALSTLSRAAAVAAEVEVDKAETADGLARRARVSSRAGSEHRITVL
jgi:hypothetical protein